MGLFGSHRCSPAMGPAAATVVVGVVAAATAVAAGRYNSVSAVLETFSLSSLDSLLNGKKIRFSSNFGTRHFIRHR